MRLNRPRRPRDVFQLLALLDRDGGAEALLDRVDWSGATPRDIYHAFFDRPPDAPDLAIPRADYSPRSHALGALRSAEFQDRAVLRALAAFPEKRRLLFVHIPKCAGTDLKDNLSINLPWLYQEMTQQGWTGPDALLAALQAFAIRVNIADSIFVSGHIPLDWYLQHRLYRAGDRLFAVVRHPLDIMLSLANYIIRRFFERPDCGAPDTREWADMLGMARFDPATPPAGLRALAGRILTEPRIVHGRYLCHFLGTGTAESARAMLARVDIELTDTAHYREWLRAAWGIDSQSRGNASPPVLRAEDLDPEQRDALWDLCAEDRALHDRITAGIARRGDGRVFGPELG